MAGSLSDRCGYTWPDDHELDDLPDHQHCCWRETTNDAEYCVWHADSDEVSKSVEELQQARVPPEVREQNSPYAELLDGAQLSDLSLRDAISFERVRLRDSNFTNTNLRDANFFDANLLSANLINANLQGADLIDAAIWDADLTEADLRDANLTNAAFWGADLINANLLRADLTDADLPSADLTDADLPNTSLTGANLQDADLIGAGIWDADLTDANLRDADLTNANFKGSDLTDANFAKANLTSATLEHAVLVRTNLFDANLTSCRPHGATFTDVQINDKTELRSEDHRKVDAHWWQKGPFLPPQRCGYDPMIADEDDDTETDQLGKAADTYQTFETLARENARPSLQSEMFVLRQDMQRKRHWHNDEYFEWAFARVSRSVFKYGESLGRIVTCAVVLIAAYAAIYARFDLIRDVDNQFVKAPVDALYFSTLTFTTLGLGDFQPESASQVARLLVTSQAAAGAILIAIFVFVLGRRAAR